jgi:hypothetical protein
MLIPAPEKFNKQKAAPVTGARPSSGAAMFNWHGRGMVFRRVYFLRHHRCFITLLRPGTGALRILKTCHQARNSDLPSFKSFCTSASDFASA